MELSFNLIVCCFIAETLERHHFFFQPTFCPPLVRSIVRSINRNRIFTMKNVSKKPSGFFSSHVQPVKPACGLAFWIYGHFVTRFVCTRMENKRFDVHICYFLFSLESTRTQLFTSTNTRSRKVLHKILSRDLSLSLSLDLLFSLFRHFLSFFAYDWSTNKLSEVNFRCWKHVQNDCQSLLHTCCRELFQRLR